MNFLKCSFNGPLATANLNTEQTSFYSWPQHIYLQHHYFLCTVYYYVHFEVKIHTPFFHHIKEPDKLHNWYSC